MMCLAPVSMSSCSERKPQVTPMGRKPAFTAVCMSAAVSPR